MGGDPAKISSLLSNGQIAGGKLLGRLPASASDPIEVVIQDLVSRPSRERIRLTGIDLLPPCAMQISEIRLVTCPDPKCGACCHWHYQAEQR